MTRLIFLPRVIAVIFDIAFSAFFLFTLLSLIAPSLALSQDSSKSETPKREIINVKLLDQQIVDKGRGMSQVFLVSSDGEIHHAGEAKTIVKPTEVKDEDLAYFSIYFTGRSGEIANGVIVLVADFDTKKPKFYIDQNNDLDFTDDGKSKVVRGKDNGFILELIGDAPDSKFAINLLPFRDDKSMTAEKRDQYREMFQGLESYTGGKFTDVEHWYYNQRLNTRTNSVEVEGQKVMIGLHDYDCDGLYSGEKDRLLIGKFGADEISYALADGAINVVQNEICMIGDEPYRIVEAIADGSSVRIEKSDELPERLFVGSSVPDLQLKSFDGGSVGMDELVEPGKLLVLDFWGHWCAPCVASIPSTIEFHEKWNEKVSFVGVHFGDHEDAKRLVKEKRVPFPQFEVSDELKEVFFIDAWPSYVVIDADGKLVSFRSSLKEIAEMLEEKN